MEKITEYLIASTVNEKGIVRAWEETVMLPSYEIGKEEKYPVFSEKRVYQGSSGVVYPYAVVEKIFDEKKDKAFRAVFIENEYLKIMILPELGGRIQMAYDKIKKRHFVYYNQVIKPALVGLTGPWISGGIEFNWPQHHRPGTFLPVEALIEDNKDGSFTVWCSEVEKMFRTKGMHGVTLYPGKAFMEIKVKLYNRTCFPQTFLWWANPAVVVNDHYHSVFPPDVHAVFDHGKRDVSEFPIARGVYYKQDYSKGVDISRYKNIPVPTSFMAVNSKYDFVGGYEEDTQAGLLHVANHNISPGKKQWTWGNGDFGLAWDRNLTDEDGPYIELMTGVFTDNQPDFSWLQPGEEKSWSQFFMPYSEVGYVKNASKDAVVNVEVVSGNANIVLYTTSEFKNLRVILRDKSGEVLLNEDVDVSPITVYKKSVSLKNTLDSDFIFELYSSDGQLMLNYLAEKQQEKPTPDPAKPAEEPSKINSVEKLYLTGLHLEQYRHATYNPLDYYFEALKREPGDVRCNNAAGLYLLRRGQFEKSESYFRASIATITEMNPNPYDGECFYNLGWSLKMQGKYEDAYNAFYKSVWNASWQDAGYYAIALLESKNRKWADALYSLDRSLIRNWHNHKARHIKTAILRSIGRTNEAVSLINESVKIDAFNLGCMFEKYLISGATEDITAIYNLFNEKSDTYIEYALDYADAGFIDDAISLLGIVTSKISGDNIMLYYTIAALYYLKADINNAKQYSEIASKMSTDACFPNRIEDINILKTAIKLNASDYKAYYLLGNFWYGNRQYEEAVLCWENALRLNDTFSPVLRNLSLAYFNKYNKWNVALDLMERAFKYDNKNARLLMELDQLYKKMCIDLTIRFNLLNSNIDLVKSRDDLFIEFISLYNLFGEYEMAGKLIDSRQFHPWEGGEGKIAGQYLLNRVQRAKVAIGEGDFRRAFVLLSETDTYPHNLGEGKLCNIEENDINFYKGLVVSGLGDSEKAGRYFESVADSKASLNIAMYYNDQKADNVFYKGLALKQLGKLNQAEECFNLMIKYGNDHINDNCKIDYFAVSLPDLAIWESDLNTANVIHCNYLIGLGYLGLGRLSKSEEYFKKVLELDLYNIECRSFLNDTDFYKNLIL